MMKAVLVGLQLNPSFRRTLAVSALKASADRDEDLRGRADVRCLEFTIPEADRVLPSIVAENPSVVGFSCYMWNFAVFSALWPRLKAALPEALIVVGGPEVSPQARKVLRDHPAVDAVALGESEATFPALLKARIAGEDLARVPGLAYRAGSGVLATPEAPAPLDLDALASPYLSGSVNFSPGDRYFTIETSRGCPFDCKYCDWPGRLQKARPFSIDRVVSEVEYILERAPDVHELFVADSDIFVDRPRARELLTRLKSSLIGSDVKITLLIYLARLDASLIEILDSKHFVLCAGIQTITPEALKTVDRFFHAAKTEEAVQLMHRRCPSATFMFETIYGLPGDSHEDYRRTLNWTLSLKPEIITVYEALALPGADLGQHPENYRVEIEPGPPHRVLSSARYGREDMRRTHRAGCSLEALQRFPFVRNAVARLGAHLQGAERLGYLECYEELAARLERRGLPTASDDPPPDVADVGGLGFAAFLGIKKDESKTLALLDELADFAREKTAGGPPRLAAALLRYLEIRRGEVLWMKRLRAAGAPARLADALSSVRSARWVGTEDLSEETTLLASRFPSARFVHFSVSGRHHGLCGLPAAHAADARELEERLLNEAAVDDAVVFSLVYTRLEAPFRKNLAAKLRDRARSGSRLLIVDDLLGWSHLESLAAISTGVAEDAGPVALDELLAELQEAGWTPDGPIEKLEPFTVVSMIR